MIAGLGKSGVGAMRLALSQDIKVFACEKKRASEWEKCGETIPPQVKVEFESNGFELLDEVTDVIVSPGISYKSDFVKRAINKKKNVMSEIEFASRYTTVPIIAVTGTNGKTTVTKLINEILRKDGKESIEAGNIGTSLSEVVSQNFKGDYIVCEISSFQLELISNLKPHISLLLNITPDHLDRYDSLDEYADTKMRIFENLSDEDFGIINADDSLIMTKLSKLRGQTFFFSRTQSKIKGAYVDSGEIVFRDLKFAENIMPIERIKMKGCHNLENALSAVSVSMIVDVKKEVVAEVLEKFLPPSHRMEEVANINNVLFINDSKATNIDALKRALEGIEEKVILIAGGRDKNGDFASITDEVKSSVRLIIAIGEAAGKIEKAFSDIVEVFRAKTLEEAVNKAYRIARPGEVVLLSPGCASFDMFDSYEHRGDEFKRCVRKLYEN